MSIKINRHIVIFVLLVGFAAFSNCYTIVVPPGQYRPAYVEEPEAGVEEEYEGGVYSDTLNAPVYNFNFFDPYAYSWGGFGYYYDPFLYDPMWSFHLYSPWGFNRLFGYSRWGMGYSPYGYYGYYDPWYGGYYPYYGLSYGYGYYDPWYGRYYRSYYNFALSPYKKRNFTKRREIVRGSGIGITTTADRNVRTSPVSSGLSGTTGIGKSSVSSRSISKSGTSSSSGSVVQSRTKSSSSTTTSSSSSKRRIIRSVPVTRKGSNTSSVGKKTTGSSSKGSASTKKTKSRTVKKKKGGGGEYYSSAARRSTQKMYASRSVIPSSISKYISRLRELNQRSINSRSRYSNPGRTSGYTLPRMSRSGVNSVRQRSYSPPSVSRVSRSGGTRMSAPPVSRASSRSTSVRRVVKKRD